MLAFNELGNNGRLGNQMFQYAALKGIASRRGYDYCIPPFNIPRVDNYSLNRCFKLSSLTQNNFGILDRGHAPVVREMQFHYDEVLHNLCPNDVSIHGFFQSEKYFKHIRDQLLIDFEFHDNIMEPAKNAVSNWNNPIALHVRRTDYITNSNHSVLSIDYYQKALEYFDDDCEILIFSDDPQWCFQQKLFDSDRFLVSETNNNYIDLCLMTLCSGHIIANSSFSWWGAWLSNGEKVIAPSCWFKGSNNENLDIKDLFPETWTVI